MLSCDLVFKCLLSVSQTLSVHVKDLYEDCVNLFFNLILVEIHCWQIFVVFASSKLDSVFCLLLTLHFSVLLQYFTFDVWHIEWCLLCFAGFDVWHIEWCLLCFAGFDVWHIEWCLLCFAGFDVWYIEWCLLCFAGFDVWHIEW